MPSFPTPSIISARLELREFSLADGDLVREVAANAEPRRYRPVRRLTPGGWTTGWLRISDCRSLKAPPFT